MGPGSASRPREVRRDKRGNFAKAPQCGAFFFAQQATAVSLITALEVRSSKRGIAKGSAFRLPGNRQDAAAWPIFLRLIEGTTSTRSLLLRRICRCCQRAQREVARSYPQPVWGPARSANDLAGRSPYRAGGERAKSNARVAAIGIANLAGKPQSSGGRAATGHRTLSRHSLGGPAHRGGVRAA